jgi:hypothetical protein
MHDVLHFRRREMRQFGPWRSPASGLDARFSITGPAPMIGVSLAGPGHLGHRLPQLQPSYRGALEFTREPPSHGAAMVELLRRPGDANDGVSAGHTLTGPTKAYQCLDTTCIGCNGSISCLSPSSKG